MVIEVSSIQSAIIPEQKTTGAFFPPYCSVMRSTASQDHCPAVLPIPQANNHPIWYGECKKKTFMQVLPRLHVDISLLPRFRLSLQYAITHLSIGADSFIYTSFYTSFDIFTARQHHSTEVPLFLLIVARHQFRGVAPLRTIF